MSEVERSSWIHHFPENFMWSNATLVAKGMAPWSAVALEEVDRIAARLQGRIGDTEAWWQEWSAMGERVERVGREAAAAGRQFTAGNCFLRAGTYYFTGERFVPPGELKMRLYRSALRCYRDGLERRYPSLEMVEVPYEGGSLPAYFMKAEGGASRAPTVVLFDGLDNCKEMSVIFAGVEFAKRGFNTLAIDGPGQGEALRLRNIVSRYDYEVAGTAAYEYVASRPDVDTGRVAIAAYSMGGYYAPRTAAFEKRYAACVAWGGHFDVYAAWLVRWQAMKSDGNKVATSHFQLPWVLGTPDMETAMAKLRDFTLAGVAEKITCPFLVTHGENDRLISPMRARELYAAVGSQRKAIRIFTAEDGGAEHCQVDNRQVGTDFVADWLAANL